MARVILKHVNKGIVDVWCFDSLEAARGKHEALLNALKHSESAMWRLKIKPEKGDE